jgi:hypothetical protein
MDLVMLLESLFAWSDAGDILGDNGYQDGNLKASSAWPASVLAYGLDREQRSQAV